MSNHVATITKNEGRCSFSRKALSVFMAVLLAFLMMPMIPAESAQAATFDNWEITATADNGLDTGDSATVTVSLTVKNTTQPQSSATVTLYKGDVQVGDSDLVTWSGTSNNYTGTATFKVDEGGFYTARTTYNSDPAKVIGDVEVTVTDAAANALWEGHEIVPTQEAADAYGNYVFDETGSPVDFGVDEVLGIDDEPISSGDYKVVYYSSTDNEWDASDTELDGAPTKAGDYLLAAWPTEDYIAGVTQPIVVPFQIVASEKTYSIYEIDPNDGTDVSDTEFVYDGGNFLATESGSNVVADLGLAVDGKPAELKLVNLGQSYDTTEAGTGLKAGDYFIKTVDGTAVSAGNGNDATSADEYELGIAQVQAGSTNGSVVAPANTPVVAIAKMTVQQFDVSQAVVTASDQKAVTSGGDLSGVSLTYKGVTFDGVTFGGAGKNKAYNSVIDAGALELKVASFDAAVDSGAPAGYQGFFGYAGEYGIEVSAVAGADGKYAGNFTMSGDPATATVNILASGATVYTDFAYDGTSFGTYSDANALFIDKSKGQAFDPEEISWNGGKTSYDGRNATVAYYDVQTGEAVSSLDATGTYKVVVTVDPGVKFDRGGTGTMYVRVANGAGATVYMAFDGKPVADKAGLTVTETGEAFPVEVTVKSDDGKVLAQGTDYSVEIRDTDANVAVDEIRDFGNYSVAVKPTGFDFKGTSFSVSVQKGSFEGFEIEQQTFGYDESEYQVKNSGLAVTGIPYTGQPVALTVLAYNTKTVDGETVYVYTELDPSMYDLTVTDEDGKEVDGAVEAGEYDVALATTEAFRAKYAGIDTATATFQVVDTVKAFTDVKASDWYADEATKARQMGYMQGLGDTSMLMGGANITRADVAIVLMRMAGGDADMGWGESYPSPFGDVDSRAYYAKAVDWAYKAGIVTGWDGQFRPNDFVSRQELSAMIARFAENALGQDVSVADAQAALEGYSDAGQLDGYAVETMAWCVENGVFGVNTSELFPSGTAERAQVAAIAVRLMPAEEL